MNSATILETTADDLPLRQFLTFRFSRVQAKLNELGARILQEAAGLTLTKWRIVALIDCSGPTRSTDVTRVASIDNRLFSRKLKTLVDEGFVTGAVQKDRREQLLSLTPKGEALYRRVLPVIQSRQRAFRSFLMPEEPASLHSAFGKLEAMAERDAFTS